MEELIVVLQDMTEMTVVPDKYLEEIRGQLPQNEKECRIYAMLTAATLTASFCIETATPRPSGSQTSTTRSPVPTTSAACS